jgi:hypothetical protein
MPKIIVVTPAGRARYLTLLSSFILSDPSVHKWQLWDNCRAQSDREFINELAAKHPKIEIVRLQNSKGDNRSINQYYGTLSDPDAFYIKMDDDIVFIEHGFFERFLSKAESQRGTGLWFSPLVINNAICTWLLKYAGNVRIAQPITCQAGDSIAWGNPEFCEQLHRLFLNIVSDKNLDKIRIHDYSVSLSRFSINCIGFFGDDRSKFGDNFCPLGIDDEEYISAVLPMKAGRPGRVIGSEIISHFSFFTQEKHLLRANILSSYYALQGIELQKFEAPKATFKETLKNGLLRILDDRRIRMHGRPPEMHLAK